MTTEEKYQEIVENRAKAGAVTPETKPEENEDQSGVKTDPPADTKTEPTETKPEGEPPKEGDQKPKESKEGKEPAKPSNAERQEHALAKMRIKAKLENDSLRKEIEDLKKQLAESAPKPAAKTSKDFEKPEEYEKYIRDTLKDEILAEVLNEVETQRQQRDEQQGFMTKLRGELETTFGKEIGEKVVKDLEDPESDMTMIITDERAKPIVEAIKTSKRRADLLALMQAKPQIFQNMLDLPERRKEFSIYQLEEAIEARYAQVKAKEAEDAKKKERADSLPSTGTFGVNGNGNDGINGLSTTARVNRYKEEILKNRKTK